MDNDDKTGNWQYQTDEALPEQGADAGLVQPIQWSASEYVGHEKSLGWYIIFGSASMIVGVLVYALTRSPFSAVAVLLACICLAVFGARQPSQIPYEIDGKGVRVGRRFFPYSQFKSFSLVPEGAIYTIWLRSLKKYMPTVALYFAPEDADKIIDALGQYLPHEERAPDAIDRVSQRFRF